jgi:hypothetical protein
MEQQPTNNQELLQQAAVLTLLGIVSTVLRCLGLTVVVFGVLDISLVLVIEASVFGMRFCGTTIGIDDVVVVLYKLFGAALVDVVAIS